jgi:starch synthase
MPRVLMVTPEAAPFAKTGGLGDVLGSLPQALARLVDDIAVVMPRYASVRLDHPERIAGDLRVRVGPHEFSSAVDEVRWGGVPYFFVDCPALYGRAGIYGEAGRDYTDNHIRFALLNLAAIEIARRFFRAEVLHGHDWPAGLLGVYLREYFGNDPVFSGTKFVFTIHNLGYQGNFPPSALPEIGLSHSVYHPGGLEFWGQMSLLKAGLVWADAITTVSPTYAAEIQTPEQGHGMDGILRERSSRITGILNGVDYSQWDPRCDPFIPHHYSADDLSGKLAARVALLKEMGLPNHPGRPVIGIVSRFASQKGFDLIDEIADDLAREEMCLVALGTGERQYEDLFRRLAREYPEKFAAQIGFDNALAHRIEAGSDMFLMPSHYEPCGLNQMYSLRYGTVPIVRATGGLEDTVDETTGFKFREYSGRALLGAIRQALAAWQDREEWTARMRRGMAKDFSWDASAAEYHRLYRSL